MSKSEQDTKQTNDPNARPSDKRQETEEERRKREALERQQGNIANPQ